MLVTLNAIFLSFSIEIERDYQTRAASVNFSTGVTVPVIFPSYNRSTNDLTGFAAIGGTVILSWTRRTWGLALVPLDVLLICSVRCGRGMKPCVVSMTTLLCLMNCNPIIGPVKLFTTTNCSAKIWSPKSQILSSNIKLFIGPCGEVSILYPNVENFGFILNG